MLHALTRANFIGPWAGLPVAWTDDDRFHEAAFRADVAHCCEAGVPGVYSGGTTGEMYAIEYDEFEPINRAMVEECHARSVPAMIGCTHTSTRGAQRRAAFARAIGADAIQVALPYWMEVHDSQVLPFFRAVHEASGGLPLSVYETTRAKKALTIEQHRALHEAIPQYLMVKANAGTVGATAEGCEALSKFVNVFTVERLWPALGPKGVIGCCSAEVYANPRITLRQFELLRTKQWEALAKACQPLLALGEFFAREYAPRGFTDTAYDRMRGRATGFLQASLRCRGPYVAPTEADVELLRQWYRENHPQMLEL